jgi:mono/diheme cytochrome c family protein
LVIRAIRVVGVRRHEDEAIVTIAFEKGEHGLKLSLLLSDKRWLIQTRPLLAPVKGCRGVPEATGCAPNSRVIVFGFASLLPGEVSTIAPPAAVRRAGGRELREFEAGARVAVASGCLACHRIGDQGNSRPGPDLTHVGSRLDEAQIMHAIRDAREPMPSFRYLPKAKFHALVRFLRLLR